MKLNFLEYFETSSRRKRFEKKVLELLKWQPTYFLLPTKCTLCGDWVWFEKGWMKFVAWQFRIEDIRSIGDLDIKDVCQKCEKYIGVRNEQKNSKEE